MSAPEHSDPRPSPQAIGIKELLSAKSFREKGAAWKFGIFAAVLAIALTGLSWYWSIEPQRFDVVEVAA